MGVFLAIDANSHHQTCTSGLHGNWVERTFQRSINIWQELRAATRLTGRKERLRCGHRRSTLPLAEQLEPRAVLSGDGVGVAVTAGDVTFDSLGNGYMVGSFSGTVDWARTVRGLGEDSVADVATGLDGSIVIVGEIESTTPPPTTPNGWYEHDGRDDDREQGFVGKLDADDLLELHRLSQAQLALLKVWLAAATNGGAAPAPVASLSAATFATYGGASTASASSGQTTKTSFFANPGIG